MITQKRLKEEIELNPYTTINILEKIIGHKIELSVKDYDKLKEKRGFD